MNAFASTSRTISIVSAVVGGVALLGVGGGAAVSQIFAPANSSDGAGTQTASVAGVSSLTVESSSSDFTLRFDDVSEAELKVTGQSRERWSLESSGDELSVENHQRFWDWCIGWCAPGNDRVTLTLPESMNDGSLNADLSLGAGSMTAAGGFRSLDLGVGAGSLTFEGSARELGGDISAGRADIAVSDVRSADFDVSAGRATVALTGDAPQSVALDVSAGSLKLELPDETYDLRSDVSAGSLDNGLDVSTGAKRVITASVSAGSATLIPGR